MSENLVDDQDPQQKLKLAIAERVTEQLGWLQEAAQVIGGPDATVESAFRQPEVVGDIARNDAEIPDWTEEQVVAVTAIARRFGYGAQETVPSGLSGGTRLAEGGKVWKIMAEINSLEAEADVDTFVFKGSPFRSLGDDELKFLKEKHEIELPFGATEYDFVVVMAQSYATKLYDEPIVLPIGYEVAPGNEVIYKPTGQLLEFGTTSADQAVQVLQVAGEQYFDEEKGRTQERYRPDTACIMGMFAAKLTAEGDMLSPIAEGTSNTYASRVPDIIRAGLSLQPPRNLGVNMYGRQGIIALGAPVPAELPLNHLPGDLRLMHDKLQKLRAELLV